MMLMLTLLAAATGFLIGLAVMLPVLATPPAKGANDEDH